MPTRSESGQTWTGLVASCNHCGASKTFTREQMRRDRPELDMVPCQGSDQCTAMLCPTCRRECPTCGNFTCREHLHEFDGEDSCEVCRMQRVAEVALETQDIAQFIAACSAAGLTLDEARALNRMVN